MSKSYGVISDTHNHNWATFSHILKETGLNNRLQHILDETWRAAARVRDEGGEVLVHCGDLFHVRGNIAPSVLNPTLELYRKIVNELGIEVRILAGNHDLEGNDADELGNAAVALRGEGCHVYSETYFCKALKHLYVPYCHSVKQLRNALKEYVAQLGDEISEWTLFLHAPMNGVIAGIPDNGLSATELKALGFKRVFCGHYHNHRNFDQKVFSIGSITHQTFSDVDSKAGFLIVNESEVTHFPTSAPKFVDFDPDWTDEEQAEYVIGNYVRVRLQEATNDDVEATRKLLTELGAAQVQIIHVPAKSVESRKGKSIDAGASVRVSISDWCKAQEYDDEVAQLAQEIADEVNVR